MLKCIRNISLIILHLVYVKLESSADEYCNWEVFQPRCSQNEIIVIDEAVYGRRKMGKCLIEEGTPSENYLGDPKFLGCYLDVKHIMEPICAGKSQCDVSVAKVKTETACHKWLMPYLEVSYNCLQVIQENRHCTISASGDRQYLTTSFVSKEGCGSKQRPWTIETIMGQRINFSLISYMSNSKISNEEVIYFQQKSLSHGIDCRNIGQIVDTNNKKTVKLCLEKGRKAMDNSSYTSDSNSVELSLDAEASSYGLILNIAATGCPDLIPPADAWLKRTKDEAIIGCYSTRLRWQLKCIGQRWMGVIGNCSQGYSASEFQDTLIKTAIQNNDQVIHIVAVAMVGFVICFLIVCIGIVLLNRYYAMGKVKAMKHNMKADMTLPLYNGQSINCLNNNPQYKADLVGGVDTFLANGSTLKHDGGQYFELDQKLVNSN